ncbi:conserved hypothetical protein [Tenacibaculum litopenaei]
MTYNDCFLFLSQCLTLSHSSKHHQSVKYTLENTTMDWEALVKLSTTHYVLPAWYYNLKTANFLNFLPEDLVAYMEHIAELNTDRNTEIIKQAQEINTLLQQEGIVPIFLKGTGNLLSKLYKHPGERMIGDIDFLVAPENLGKAQELLLNVGYTPIAADALDAPITKHLPRIAHAHKIAAVEVHKDMTIGKYAEEFNYATIKDNLSVSDQIHTLSDVHKLDLSIIAKQINDDGQFFKNLSLRNAYDVLCLSFQSPEHPGFHKYRLLSSPLNNFVCLCGYVFDLPIFNFEFDASAKAYLENFKKLLSSDRYRKRQFKKTKRRVFLNSRARMIAKAITDKTLRKWLIKHLFSREWINRRILKKTPTQTS